jgi:hypothetical protein
VHRYRVTGFDGSGVELFALKVDGVNEQDAQRIAMRDLGNNANGSWRADQVERFEVELVWRSVAVTETKVSPKRSGRRGS